jgi:hypothetical protein
MASILKDTLKRHGRITALRFLVFFLVAVIVAAGVVPPMTVKADPIVIGGSLMLLVMAMLTSAGLVFENTYQHTQAAELAIDTMPIDMLTQIQNLPLLAISGLVYYWPQGINWISNIPKGLWNNFRTWLYVNFLPKIHGQVVMSNEGFYVTLPNGIYKVQTHSSADYTRRFMSNGVLVHAGSGGIEQAVPMTSMFTLYNLGVPDHYITRYRSNTIIINGVSVYSDKIYMYDGPLAINQYGILLNHPNRTTIIVSVNGAIIGSQQFGNHIMPMFSFVNNNRNLCLRVYYNHSVYDYGQLYHNYGVIENEMRFMDTVIIRDFFPAVPYAPVFNADAMLHNPPLAADDDVVLAIPGTAEGFGGLGWQDIFTNYDGENRVGAGGLLAQLDRIAGEMSGVRTQMAMQGLMPAVMTGLISLQTELDRLRGYIRSGAIPIDNTADRVIVGGIVTGLDDLLERLRKGLVIPLNPVEMLVLSGDITDTRDIIKEYVDSKTGTGQQEPPDGKPIYPMDSYIFAMFPFTIPLRVMEFFEAVTSSQIEPRFEFNLFPAEVTDKWGFSVEPIVIDFDRFGNIVTIVRYGFLIMFIVGLISVSKRYIWTGGG